MNLPLLSLPVSTGPPYAKRGLVWGLFTEMCYSHQTGPLKSQHVVLLLEHPGESQHQADSACISSSVSSFSSLIPGTPTPPPKFPSSWPHTSHTVSESPQLSTPSVDLLSTLNHSVWCLARSICLSSIQSASQAGLPVCTQSDHTWKPGNRQPRRTRCSSSV